jgi:hypothetical protein
MAVKLHIADRVMTLRSTVRPPGSRRTIRFRDLDFLTTEQLGPQQSLTPEGFLCIRSVPLARCGPQLYSDQEIPLQGDASGRIVVDRLPADVFDPQTIASLQGKPVTLDHPDDDVSPENYSDLAVGHVLNPRRGTGVLDNLLLGDLIVTDPQAIKAIRSKQLREVSVGYRANYVETGVGRGRQQNIVCNHVALVADGRCGPACRIGDRAFFTRTTDMRRTRDQQPSENNLGPGGSRLGFLPGTRDQGAEGSQGTPGTAFGGSPRRAQRPEKPAAIQSGSFTVDDEVEGERRPPSSQFAPSRTENDGRDPSDENEDRYGRMDSGLGHPLGDQEEEPFDEEGLGEIVNRIPAPEEGSVLVLVPQDDGSIAIVEQLDDGSDMSTADRTYRHRISDGRDPLLARMNSIARRRWSRTSDATLGDTQQSTIYTHRPLAPGHRLELQGPNELGTFDLVLFSGTYDLTGPTPPGASGSAGQRDNPGKMKPTQTWSSASGSRPGELNIREIEQGAAFGRTRDRRGSEAVKLAAMNKSAKEYWAAHR